LADASSVALVVRLFIILAGSVSALGAPSIATAHDGYHWDFRYDFDIPTQGFDSREISDGLGFEGTVSYGLSPEISIYAGWSLRRFKSDLPLESRSINVQDSGYGVGIQWEYLTGDSSIAYRVRVGAKYNIIELENQREQLLSASDRYLGWEIAFALMIPLGDHWELTPGIRFTSLPTDVLLNSQASIDRFEYVSIGIGISHRF